MCADFQARNPKEPMQTPKVSDCPWSRVAVDMFTLERKEYVVLVDYYSDFIGVQELSDVASASVIQFLKEQLSRHGIPDVLVSDNGPQWTFDKEWVFRHVTSSPPRHKSNGKAEAAVKVTTNLMKKTFRDERDPWLALLEYQNTPTKAVGSSPDLCPERPRLLCLLPQPSSALRVVEGVESQIKSKRLKAKF